MIAGPNRGGTIKSGGSSRVLGREGERRLQREAAAAAEKLALWWKQVQSLMNRRQVLFGAC